MKCFGPIRAKAKLTPQLYYKITIIIIIKILTINDIERYEQMNRAHFHFVTSHLKELEKKTNYITKIGNKSPAIPY